LIDQAKVEAASVG